jgi:hypothetical protein
MALDALNRPGFGAHPGQTTLLSQEGTMEDDEAV